MKAPRLLSFLLRHADGDLSLRRRISLGLLTSAVAGLAGTGLIALANAALHDPAARTPLLLAGFTALGLMVPATSFASVYLMNTAVRQAEMHLSMELCRGILATPLERLEEIGIPRVLATLTVDTRTLSKSLAIVPTLARGLLIVAGCLAYMAWLSRPLFLLVAAFGIAGAFGFRIPNLRSRAHFKRSRRARDELFLHFRALTEGNKELKLHQGRGQAFLDDRVEVSARERMRHEILGHALHAVAGGWSRLIFALLLGVMIFAVSAPAQTLTGYILATIYFFGALEAVLEQGPTLSRATVAMDNIDSLGVLLQEGPREAVRDEAGPALPSWSRLELADVRFSYRSADGQPFSLGPVDLSLRPGELVFVVGGNGSGKTTLAKLLTGLYYPTEGEVRVDGRPVAKQELPLYRRLFSAVFSDFYLFDSLLGLAADGLDAQAQRILDEMELGGKVDVADGRLSTLDLSQGQRKRLALLVACLEDRPIYLFDEWAADQDPHFREVFYRRILPSLKERGKAVVVISHDDRYYGLGDRIVKLSEGQIEYDRPRAEWTAEPAGTGSGLVTAPILPPPISARPQKEVRDEARRLHSHE